MVFRDKGDNFFLRIVTFNRDSLFCPPMFMF